MAKEESLRRIKAGYYRLDRYEIIHETSSIWRIWEARERIGRNEEFEPLEGWPTMQEAVAAVRQSMRLEAKLADEQAENYHPASPLEPS